MLMYLIISNQLCCDNLEHLYKIIFKRYSLLTRNIKIVKFMSLAV